MQYKRGKEKPFWLIEVYIFVAKVLYMFGSWVLGIVFVPALSDRRFVADQICELFPDRKIASNAWKKAWGYRLPISIRAPLPFLVRIADTPFTSKRREFLRQRGKKPTV